MLVFTDEQGRIKDIGSTENKELKEVYIDENDNTFPFREWTETRIKGYQIGVESGIVTMYTPYVPLEDIEEQEKESACV